MTSIGGKKISEKDAVATSRALELEEVGIIVIKENDLPLQERIRRRLGSHKIRSIKHNGKVIIMTNQFIEGLIECWDYDNKKSKRKTV